MMKKEELKQLWTQPFYRTCMILFFLMLLLNVFTIQIADDFGYQINNGILDIFHREYIQYMTWTGRSVAHIIARIFLALPKIIFDLCNSACFVCLCVLIYKHAFDEEVKEAIYLLLIVVLLFLFAPVFGQTVLWETGSCNYLWTTTIVLYFFYLYRTKEKVNPIGITVLGLVAGWTNENTGGALILLLLFHLYQCWKEKKKIASWKYLGLCGTIVGYAFLILAPGNRVRALDFVNTDGKAYTIIHDFMNFLDVLEQGELILWLLFVVLLAFSLLANKKRSIRIACYFALASIAAVFAIILTPVPVLYDRSMFGACVFLIIAIMILTNSLLDDDLIPQLLRVVLSIFVLFASFAYLRAFADLAYTRYQDHNRNQYIETQKSLGNLNPTLPIINNEFITKYNPLYGMHDITPYRLYWVNTNYAQAHGLESVQGTPLNRWNTIYKEGDPTLMNMTDFNQYTDYLKAHLEYEVLFTSSELDTVAYESYLNKLLGVDDIVDHFYESGYLIGDFDGLSLNFDEHTLDGTIDGHYYYISSMRDSSKADILFDGIEYTNDQPGISIVVYDKAKGRIVDSVTWTYDSDQGGTRYYIEK